MLKALSDTCPAGQHWSEQFGGCATDATPTPPSNDFFSVIGRYPVISIGIGFFLIMLLRGGKR